MIIKVVTIKDSVVDPKPWHLRWHQGPDRSHLQLKGHLRGYDDGQIQILYRILKLSTSSELDRVTFELRVGIGAHERVSHLAFIHIEDRVEIHQGYQERCDHPFCLVVDA